MNSKYLVELRNKKEKTIIAADDFLTDIFLSKIIFKDIDGKKIAMFDKDEVESIIMLDKKEI